MIDPHDSGSKFLNIFQPEEHISDNRISEYGYLTIQVFLFADSGRKPSRRTDLNPVRIHTDFYRCRDIPHSMDQSIGYCFPEGFFRDFVNTFPFGSLYFFILIILSEHLKCFFQLRKYGNIFQWFPVHDLIYGITKTYDIYSRKLIIISKKCSCIIEPTLIRIQFKSF